MEIKLDCSKYLKKINKAEVVKNLFDFNWGSALTDVIDVDYSIEMKAFMLLFNSSRETNFQLSKAYGQKELNKEYNLVSISKAFENDYKNFLEQNIVLTKEFFTNVLASDNNYLIYSYNLFEKFCAELKIKVPDDIRIHYYINFRENLQAEYHGNKERYQELEDFFKNPVALQNDSIAHLLEEYSKFKRFYTNPLQQNSPQKETLQDLYIEPFFSIYKNNLVEIPAEKDYEDFHSHSEKETIHQFFNKYFLADKKPKFLKQNYDMVFVLGQPGQGKTSFCYKLLYDYIENNSDLPPSPVIFMKIRDLVAKDFINDPFSVIAEHYRFLNFTKDKFILVLDGLDESYMSGGIANEDLRNLYERLKKRSNKQIKIILTSRFNFLNIDDSCLDNTLVLHLNELADNQINEYCEKFKNFYPENSLAKSIKSILDTKQYEHIKELLRQAVLIYFIAISDIEIEEKDSKSKIYDKIFDSLAQRSWDSNGQLDYINPKLKSNPSLYKSYLREYIRNIAFEIYHSPKLYLTVNKLLELDATKLFVKRCFNDSLDETKDKIKEFSKYLLISFYFQQTNKGNVDTALEFFHNSLWEFLTAEHLWEQNKKVLLKKDEYDEFEIISKEDYFTFLNNSVGNKKINEFSVTKNLVEIIENDENIVKDNVFKQSINLFYELSKDDYLFEYQRKKCLLSPFEKATEIFTLFWIFVHESNKNIKEMIKSDSKILDFLFIYSNRKFNNNEIYNLKISEDFLNTNSRDIYNGKLVDCKIIDDLYNYRFFETQIINVDFENVMVSRFGCERNVFENINVVQNFFDYTAVFIDNTFKNTKIHETQVPNKDWYERFLENNTFDNDFSKKHYLDIRKTKNRSNVEEERFYIMCKDFETEE